MFIVVSLPVSKLDKAFMKVFLVALRNDTDEGAEVLNYPDAKKFSRQGRGFSCVVGTLQVLMNQCIWNLMEQVQNCQKGLFNIEYACTVNSREENPVSAKRM